MLKRNELDALEERYSRIIGHCVRERRMSLGWSQQRLADASGLSRAEIQFVERGRRRAKIGTVRRLCAALGVTYLELAAQAERVDREWEKLGRREKKCIGKTRRLALPDKANPCGVGGGRWL